MDKGEVARRQLGTALDLFLRGQDPVSVHTLAMAGGEIAERLAEKAGAETLISHIRATFPDMKEQDLRNIQRKYYNAFKHATKTKIGGKDRDDDGVLKIFNPQSNDHVLYHGWHDLTVSRLPIPIEAQVYEVWYFAKYSEKVKSGSGHFSSHKPFPILFVMFSPAPTQRFGRCYPEGKEKRQRYGRSGYRQTPVDIAVGVREAPCSMSIVGSANFSELCAGRVADGDADLLVVGMGMTSRNLLRAN